MDNIHTEVVEIATQGKRVVAGLKENISKDIAALCATVGETQRGVDILYLVRMGYAEAADRLSSCPLKHDLGYVIYKK